MDDKLKEMTEWKDNAYKQIQDLKDAIYGKEWSGGRTTDEAIERAKKLREGEVSSQQEFKRLWEEIDSIKEWNIERASRFVVTENQLGIEIAKLQVEAERGMIAWSNTHMAFAILRCKVRDFIRGVVKTKWLSKEPRVIGFKYEFEAMQAEVAKETPKLPTFDEVFLASINESKNPN